MEKIPDKHVSTLTQGKGRLCRVAYTLNNEQPVRCSIIGDQPLFYMDFEGDIIDEEVLDLGIEFGFTAIENGLKEIQEKISALDRLAGMIPDRPADRIVEMFLDDLDRATSSSQKEEGTALSIEELEKTLRRSRFGSALLDHAATYKSEIRHSRQTPTATYDRNSGVILISPALDADDQILLAVRELRRLWQHRNGALLHPLTFHPEQAILVNRSQIADLSVMMVRTAWELQLAGEKGPWDRLDASSMSDLTRAFARESYLDFRTLNNGLACSAVFEAWFLSERCRHEDRKLIQQMLADYQGYVFEGSQPSLNVSAELISALGKVPFGKNYLAPYVQTITNDPVFTEVRDRSNANFLWFIKFERSFRDTEQELQKTNPVRRRELLSGDSEKEERIESREKTANIVSLTPVKNGTSSAAFARGPGARGTAQIISLKPRQRE